jgi:hypothetical protein
MACPAPSRGARVATVCAFKEGLAGDGARQVGLLCAVARKDTNQVRSLLKMIFPFSVMVCAKLTAAVCCAAFVGQWR